ncbi:MAG: hypothetical protein FJX71_02500 [Alphaproteobacteria bacterium]|nr:hypothetical protein [Alphaproteobacteria bacterium]
MSQHLKSNMRTFTHSEFPQIEDKYALNLRSQNHIWDQLEFQRDECFKGIKSAPLIVNCPPDIAQKLIGGYASIFARMSIFFQQFRQPNLIQSLKDKFPDFEGETFINLVKESRDDALANEWKNDTSLSHPKDKTQKPLGRKTPLTHQSDESKSTLLQDEENTSPFKDAKEASECVSEPMDPPLDEVPFGPRITELERKRLRRAQREEQQRRAKEWVQQRHAEHLKEADLTTNRELVSTFKWMNDIINPEITLTYQSIVEKLRQIASVKNGEGSRRHFVIYDTPLGRPVACFYHEPHPDQAVRIERWRESISEALKKAGYYQYKS